MLLYLLSRTNLTPVKQKISNYLLKWRNEKPLVRGTHLRQWGYPEGPAMRPMLDRAFEAQLNGEIHSLEEARRYVESHFPKSASPPTVAVQGR